MKTNQFGTYKALRERKKNNVKNKSSFFFHSIEYITQMLDTYYFFHSDLTQSRLLFKTPVKGLNGT